MHQSLNYLIFAATYKAMQGLQNEHKQASHNTAIVGEIQYSPLETNRFYESAFWQSWKKTIIFSVIQWDTPSNSCSVKQKIKRSSQITYGMRLYSRENEKFIVFSIRSHDSKCAEVLCCEYDVLFGWNYPKFYIWQARFGDKMKERNSRICYCKWFCYSAREKKIFKR